MARLNRQRLHGLEVKYDGAGTGSGLSTVYGLTQRPGAGPGGQGIPFLRKPFTAAQLIEAANTAILQG